MRFDEIYSKRKKNKGGITILVMTREETAKQIWEIIQDYQCDWDDEEKITPDSVFAWALQFGESESAFVLSEFLHLLGNGIYFSRPKAKQVLWDCLVDMARHYKYSRISDFLNASQFLKLQPEGKSQAQLLSLVNEALNEKHGVNLAAFGKGIPKNYLYFDDVLGSGSTIVYDLKEWLTKPHPSDPQQIMVDYLIETKAQIIVVVFAYHQLSWSRAVYALKSVDSRVDRLLNLFYEYGIEDNPKSLNPGLNLALPADVHGSGPRLYLESLEAKSHFEYAFRKPNVPLVENLYSSPENRNRFEGLILSKGLEIISLIREQNNKKLRPLGFTYKSYKTLGTGTLFFTWRNISNTCPIVFWWSNPAHQWKGLFPLKNRGTTYVH